MSYQGLPQPEANVAESFSQDLDSVFGLSSNVPRGNAAANIASPAAPAAPNPKDIDGLSDTVEEQKRNVSSRSEELAAIESRLRETEERLARVSRSNASSRTTGQQHSPANAIYPTYHQEPQSQSQSYRQQASAGAESVSRPSPLAQESSAYFSSGGPGAAARQGVADNARPQNTREDSLGLPPMPGAMPQTPI